MLSGNWPLTQGSTDINEVNAIINMLLIVLVDQLVLFFDWFYTHVNSLTHMSSLTLYVLQLP